MCVFQRWRQRSGLFRHEVEECKVLGVWICVWWPQEVQGVDEANIQPSQVFVCLNSPFSLNLLSTTIFFPIHKSSPNLPVDYY